MNLIDPDPKHMQKIGFIGLGNMGAPMANNLVKAGYDVTGFDIDPAAISNLEKNGGRAANSLIEAAKNMDIIITMLPKGQHVQASMEGDNAIFAHASKNTLIIDCSTIDVATTRNLAKSANEHGFSYVDAPVSGGIMGATNASLTFMCGGDKEAFDRAKTLLIHMGKNIIHAGGAGTGQAAKLCNNMLLGISMIGVSEAFNLADALGLERQKLFDISSTASGQCWSLNTYCPVPGPVPQSPANNDYQPGFSTPMMLKDLLLSQDAANETGINTPLGEHAANLYQQFNDEGGQSLDFSAIIKFLRQQ